MARPRRCRKICTEPAYDSFKPEGISMGEEITMTVDEYEVIRLVDLEKYTHEQCAERMGISRTTVTEIYESARYKLADSVVNGKKLHISGGDYQLCDGKNVFCCNRLCKRSEESVRKIIIQRKVGAQTALKEAGIRLYGGVKGNADEAIEAYLKGNLEYNPEVHCTTHEHGHSCGEHHCGEEKHGCSGNGENQQEIKYFLWFFSKKSSGLMYLGLDVALATWYNKKQHGFIPKERKIYYETESWRTAFLGYDRVGK